MASGSSGGQRHFYGIFVSSTSMDLTAYRVAARQAIETQRQHPIMMEDFGAQNGDGSTVSTDEVARADLVLMVVAWRYGYVPAGETRSITHLEFLEAVRLDKPRLVFLAKPETEARDDLFPREQRDPEHHAQLLAFRAELGHDRAVAYFSTPDELEHAVYRAVGGWLQERGVRGKRVVSRTTTCLRLRGP